VTHGQKLLKEFERLTTLNRKLISDLDVGKQGTEGGGVAVPYYGEEFKMQLMKDMEFCPTQEVVYEKTMLLNSLSEILLNFSQSSLLQDPSYRATLLVLLQPLTIFFQANLSQFLFNQGNKIFLFVRSLWSLSKIGLFT
jgi:hypothetical protein